MKEKGIDLYLSVKKKTTIKLDGTFLSPEFQYLKFHFNLAQILQYTKNTSLRNSKAHFKKVFTIINVRKVLIYLISITLFFLNC